MFLSMSFTNPSPLHRQILYIKSSYCDGGAFCLNYVELDSDLYFARISVCSPGFYTPYLPYPKRLTVTLVVFVACNVVLLYGFLLVNHVLHYPTHA